ncbi:hypothetical protein BD311DRAFT_660342 [Dichomitus squalens]|uniref:Diphthamide biosynthesis protein 4 n=1 Tax=Dichomitus squalens TaxID=114155 RepID=A0A4Q9MRU8_9APHY|nr:hypothetical protein BD311DRAFT_660342 [Dichomitus squalens]
MHDYYSLLSVTPSATSAEIKAAYHRRLLASHPDKRASRTPEDGIDIGLLKEAFRTLSTPELRTEYDRLRRVNGKQLGPRPAQVVSLEDFDEEPDSRWTYSCRCGGTYIVTEETLEAGQHLVACASCSEVVWVGYELAEMEEEGGQ